MKVLFFTFLFFITITCNLAFSQNNIEPKQNFISVYEKFVMFHLENQHLSPDDPLSHLSLQHFIDNPIKINEATKEDLESLPLFSAIDIEKIIEYRLKHGNIYTINEIEIILSLDRITSDLLSYLLQFDNTQTTNNKTKGYMITQLSNKKSDNTQKKSGFKQYKKQIRLSLDKGCFSGKAIGESDYGESRSFYDHLSGYIQYQKSNLKIIIGDYKPSYGQGVTFSSSSFFSSNSPSEIINNYNRIKGYAQSDENHYLRGIAIEKGLHRFRIFGYYSNHRRDASIKNNDTLSYFNSLLNDGIHISETQKKKEDALKEESYGGALEYRDKRFKVIGYAHQANYALPLLKRNTITGEYFSPIAHQHYLGLSYHIYLSRFHLFGEIASDPFNQIGHLHGIYGLIWPFYKVTLGYRYYPQEYYMPYGNSYAIHSSCKNEQGPFLLQRFEVSKKISFLNSLSYFSEDQRIGTKSFISKEAYKVNTTINYIKSSSTAFQVKYQFKSSNKSFQKNQRCYPYDYNYQNFRLQGTKQLSSLFEVKTEFQYSKVHHKGKNEKGMLGMIYGKLNLASISTTYLQTTFFHTDSFYSRIFTYENDLLYNFSIPSYYGQGFHLFLLERIKLKQWCSLSTKIGYTQFIKTNQLSETSKASETIHTTSFKIMLRLKL